MTKHTPGPWECRPRPNGPFWQIHAGNQAVASVHAASAKTATGEMFKANARLIAAAPELLEALRMMLAEVIFTDTAGTDAARAAITKALGAPE